MSRKITNIIRKSIVKTVDTTSEEDAGTILIFSGSANTGKTTEVFRVARDMGMKGIKTVLISDDISADPVKLASFCIHTNRDISDDMNREDMSYIRIAKYDMLEKLIEGVEKNDKITKVNIIFDDLNWRNMGLRGANELPFNAIHCLQKATEACLEFEEKHPKFKVAACGFHSMNNGQW